MAAALALDGTYLWGALTALVVILIVWVIVLQVRVNYLVRHYDRIFAGSSDGTLREALDRYVDRLEQTTSQADALARLCQTVEEDVHRAIQRVGVVRFNPFADTGGDQSFAVALLDTHGTGVVISSLFSRNSTRVFAKAVVEGTSTYLLTEEERDAIEQAMNEEPALVSAGG